MGQLSHFPVAQLIVLRRRKCSSRIGRQPEKVIIWLWNLRNNLESDDPLKDPWPAASVAGCM
jgi:hypothetical protein